MRNESKQARQWLLQLSFLLLLLLPAVAGKSGNPTTRPLTAAPVSLCPAPNVSKTGQGAGTISFGWGPVSGALSYNCWYVRKDDNSSSGVTNVTTGSITYSGLPEGNYRFYFSTICSDGSSEYVVIEEHVF